MKKAFTIIEITICVIISILLFLGVINVLKAGMQGSSKGLSHQANMESASVLMSQIEYDLLRSTSISEPKVNCRDSIARWKFWNSHSNNWEATVTYELSNEGVVRVVELSDGKIEKTVFAKGHKVVLKFTHFTTRPSFEVRKNGMIVELTVAAKDNKKIGENESFSMKKVFVVRNQLEEIN